MRNKLRVWFILGLSLLGMTDLVAQDITLTGFQWVYPDDAPDQMPEFSKLAALPPNDDLKALDRYEYGILAVTVADNGKIASSTVNATHPSIHRDSLNRSFGKIQAAKRDGKAVYGSVWAALIFNPKSAPGTGLDVQPRWMQASPAFLPESKKEYHGVALRVTLTVTAQGEIKDIVLPDHIAGDLKAAVRRTVSEWVFLPARVNGQPQDATIEVPVLFESSPPDNLTGNDVKLPVPVKQTRPEYPLNQRIGGFRGEVVVEFVVDIEGRVRNAFVAKSSNAAFDEPAITAVLQWRFKPGEKNGRPMNCRMQVPIYFELDGGGQDAFTIQTSKKMQQALPPELRYDTAPKLVNFQPAVYPYEALVAKQRGVVDFAFFIDPAGRVTLGKVIASSSEAFTGAVQAMVDTLKFTPALKDGMPTNSLLRMKLVFNEDTGDVSTSQSADTILRKTTQDQHWKLLATASELDSKLRAISQKPPQFPSNLGQEVQSGEALVEFFIDQHGIAQLPRSISSSDPAFGYAACQAIAVWRFAPPLRDGRPVVVRVRVPVSFKR